MHTFFGRTLAIEFNFFQRFDNFFHNFDEYFSREIFEIFCQIFEKNAKLISKYQSKNVCVQKKFPKKWHLKGFVK